MNKQEIPLTCSVCKECKGTGVSKEMLVFVNALGDYSHRKCVCETCDGHGWTINFPAKLKKKMKKDNE